MGIVYKYKRFNCSHDNVLSRIESLTSRGYIKQYPSTPHVLEYVSDTVLVKHVDVTPPELVILFFYLLLCDSLPLPPPISFSRLISGVQMVCLIREVALVL